MGSRSIASTTISIGLLTVSVKIFLSAKSEVVGFNLINPTTGNRVKQILIDSVTQNIVPRTVKGYQIDHGYITFTNEELLNIQGDKKDSLNIVEFINCDDIDILKIEKTYYLGINHGDDKNYQLLYLTLKSMNKAAVGSWITRGKDHLVMIRPYKHGLIMHQMFYDNECREFENDCRNLESEISPSDIAMSKILVECLSSDKFESSKYFDHFIDKVKAAVNVKLKGEDIKIVQGRNTTYNNSTEALRDSLKNLGVSKTKITRRINSTKAL